MNKAACSEIKNLRKPAVGVDMVVISVADFIDDSAGANTWVSAKGKLYEMLRRGVGTRDRVSDVQLDILRTFVKAGITVDSIKAKSRSAGHLTNYIYAMLEL